MLPTPKTTFLRDDARCAHLTHAITRCRNSAKAAILAGELAAEGTATGVSIIGGAAGAGLASLGFAAIVGVGRNVADGFRLVTSAGTVAALATTRGVALSAANP